jgi:hypothetical protein
VFVHVFPVSVLWFSLLLACEGFVCYLLAGMLLAFVWSLRVRSGTAERDQNRAKNDNFVATEIGFVVGVFSSPTSSNALLRPTNGQANEFV